MDANPFYHNLDAVLDHFDDVCAWFKSMGFPYAQTRYGAYQRLFRELKDRVSAAKSEDALRELKERFENAYLEINEIIRVHSDLSKLGTEQFRKQMKKVISGQELRNQASGDSARDFLFELTIACRFLRTGLPVSLLGICDSVVTLRDGRTLFVECKRTRSHKKILTNVSEANKQITKRLSNHHVQTSIGMVAINVTDVMDKSHFLAPDSPAAATSIHQLQLHALIAKYPAMQEKRGHDRCLGILTESARVFYLSKRSPVQGLIYSRHATFIPYGGPESAIGQELSDLAPVISNQDIVTG